MSHANDITIFKIVIAATIVSQVWQGGSSLNVNFVVVGVGGGCGGGGEHDDDDDVSNDNISTTPWSIIRQKLIGHQLVKKFPTFCGTQLFFTEFINALHLSLS